MEIATIHNESLHARPRTEGASGSHRSSGFGTVGCDRIVDLEGRWHFAASVQGARVEAVMEARHIPQIAKLNELVQFGALLLAFVAGTGPGARITAVNGQPFALTKLEQGVRTANSSALPLTFELNGAAQTAVVNYNGSLRYPHMERIPGAVDRLRPLLVPRR